MFFGEPEAENFGGLDTKVTARSGTEICHIWNLSTVLKGDATGESAAAPLAKCGMWIRICEANLYIHSAILLLPCMAIISPPQSVTLAMV